MSIFVAPIYSKMKNRGGHCTQGFLICAERFAETVEKEKRQSVEAKDRNAVLWWLVERALLMRGR